MSAIIKPSVGRVVHFFPKEDSWAFGFYVRGGKPHAAIVTAVHSDTMVNLSVFDHNGNQFSRTSVELLQEENPDKGYDYCAWMPYQKAVAAGVIPPAVHAEPK